jgi:hypothetical protein
MKTPFLLFSALALSTVAYAQPKTKPSAAPARAVAAPVIPAPVVAPENPVVALKRLMSAAGFRDAGLQNAVGDYLAARAQSRADLLQLARDAAQSLVNPQAVAATNAADDDDDDAITPAFGRYRNALEADNVARGEQLEALDKRVNYSGTPKLEAFLTLMGVFSDEVAAIGGAEAVFERVEMAPAN